MIREATPADAELLAEIQRRSSVAALAHIYPPEDYPFPTEAVRERWRTFAGRAWLADEAGFVGVTAPWIDGLYVLPEAWGTGVSGELHEVAVEALRTSGVGRGQLWMLEHNVRARRFYERRGWLADRSTRVVDYPPHPLDVGYALIITPRA